MAALLAKVYRLNLDQGCLHKGFGEGVDVLMTFGRQLEVFGTSVVGVCRCADIPGPPQQHQVLVDGSRRGQRLLGN